MSKSSDIDPVPIVSNLGERVHEGDVFLSYWEDVFLWSLEGGDVDFMRDLVLKIRELVGPDEADDTPVIDSEDGGQVVACTDVHPGEVGVGDNSSLGDVEVVAVAAEVA